MNIGFNLFLLSLLMFNAGGDLCAGRERWFYIELIVGILYAIHIAGKVRDGA